MKSSLWMESKRYVSMVLRPQQFVALYDSVNMLQVPNYLKKKYSRQDFQAYISNLLFTGMRYEELKRLQEREDYYYRKERKIYLPMEADPKSHRVHQPRHIRLSDAGVKAIEFLWTSSPMPDSYQMDQLLHSWADRAGFESRTFNKQINRTVRNLKNEPVIEVDPEGNETIKKIRDQVQLTTNGMSVKVFRKTWECWLIWSYPHLESMIIDNQGHSRGVAISHYRSLTFDKEDIEQARKFTKGWNVLEE